MTTVLTQQVARYSAVKMSIAGASDAGGITLDQYSAAGELSGYAQSEPGLALALPGFTYDGAGGNWHAIVYGQSLALATVLNAALLTADSAYTRTSMQAVVTLLDPTYGTYLPDTPYDYALTAFTVNGVLATNLTASGTVTTYDRSGTSVDSGAMVYTGTPGSWTYRVPETAYVSQGETHTVIQMLDMGSNKLFAYEEFRRSEW